MSLVYPDREGETFGVLYNPNHKWKYLRGMEPDEIVLIKWCVNASMVLVNLKLIRSLVQL